MLDISFRDENWGQRKGGYRKVAIRGCNLTISDRIKGGKTAGNSNSVEHLKRIASLGGVGLIRSGKSPSRKTLGPNGVKMYDYLERDIFRGLLSAGMPAEYEPVIKADSRRIIPDFRVGDVYIECTRDNKVNVKAQKLVERFRLLEKRVPFSKGIVVTLPRLLVRYRQLIPSDIEVVTTQGFLANASHIDRPSPERLLLDPRPDDSPRQPLINA